MFETAAIQAILPEHTEYKQAPQRPAYSAEKTVEEPDYVVQPGDSLSEIASENDISLANLVRTSGVSAHETIYPGDVITISGPAVAPRVESAPSAEVAPVSSSATDTSIPDPVEPAGVSGVAGTALSMVGMPYVYGGKNPTGWDCSGMVSWVYAQHDMDIPSQTSAILNSGKLVRVSSPQLGDLVFQAGGSHVGIYTGDGTMISARNPSAGTTTHPTSWNGGVYGYYRYVG